MYKIFIYFISELGKINDLYTYCFNCNTPCARRTVTEYFIVKNLQNKMSSFLIINVYLDLTALFRPFVYQKQFFKQKQNTLLGYS